MKSILLSLFVVVSLAMSSCMKSSYKTNGNIGITKSEELKGFAFAGDSPEDKAMWSPLQKAVFVDLQSKNYFYDNVNPEVVVFVKELPKGVKLLSGNSTEAGLETGKMKTKGKTLLIQMVETQGYTTVWRGFAALQSDRIAAAVIQPRMVQSILNQ
ncbi:hypothetical protein [Jiulongibacter sp. NS-SX5]|uniref:hypothetical protein n=1 Tax=Jiulongibacter sp. NS-SX5 TaxID=3463854 RepID=UPI004059FD2D